MGIIIYCKIQALIQNSNLRKIMLKGKILGVLNRKVYKNQFFRKNIYCDKN